MKCDSTRDMILQLELSTFYPIFDPRSSWPPRLDRTVAIRLPVATPVPVPVPVRSPANVETVTAGKGANVFSLDVAMS